MTPAQLDLIIQGLFIYEAADGTTYKSHDYKLRDYGVNCVGRTGPLSETQWREYFALAAATRRAKTARQAECEASQSGVSASERNAQTTPSRPSETNLG
jgi:hypothetical protein